MWKYNELYHHGILGQKWGVRRYQNSDGSLTEAGKKRYGRYEEKLNVRNLEYTARSNSNKVMNLAINAYLGPGFRALYRTTPGAIKNRVSYELARFKLNYALDRIGSKHKIVWDDTNSRYRVYPENHKEELEKLVNEIYHHGIFGQKWGIRRYQNPDGSLTPEGKARYGGAEKPEWRKTVKKTNAQKKEERIKRSASKNRGVLSDEDIKNKIARLKLEKELRELTENEVSPGRKYVKQAIKNIGDKVITDLGAKAVTYTIGAVLNKNFNLKDLGKAMVPGSDKKTDPLSDLKSETERLKLEKDKLSYQKQLDKLRKENKT